LFTFAEYVQMSERNVSFSCLQLWEIRVSSISQICSTWKLLARVTPIKCAWFIFIITYLCMMVECNSCFWIVKTILFSVVKHDACYICLCYVAISCYSRRQVCLFPIFALYAVQEFTSLSIETVRNMDIIQSHIHSLILYLNKSWQS
jgi:hypothetical protein